MIKHLKTTVNLRVLCVLIVMIVGFAVNAAAQGAPPARCPCFTEQQLLNMFQSVASRSTSLITKFQCNELEFNIMATVGLPSDPEGDSLSITAFSDEGEGQCVLQINGIENGSQLIRDITAEESTACVDAICATKDALSSDFELGCDALVDVVCGF